MSIFASHEPDAILDHLMTARVPFGIILSEMIALETRGREQLLTTPLAQATDIQRELMVIDLIRRDVEAHGPYADIIEETRLGNLATLNTWHLIAPPGAALQSFRAKYLKIPTLDLSDLWYRAGQLQTLNQVPASVPPMGVIYTSAQTCLGKTGGAIVSHYALNAALLIQSACRGLVEPADRTSLSIAKVYETDPPPLRKAQELANRLLVEKRFRSPQEASQIKELMQIAVGWLFEAGFGVYAHTVINLLKAPRGPFLTYRLEPASPPRSDPPQKKG